MCFRKFCSGFQQNNANDTNEHSVLVDAKKLFKTRETQFAVYSVLGRTMTLKIYSLSKVESALLYTLS